MASFAVTVGLAGGVWARPVTSTIPAAHAVSRTSTDPAPTAGKDDVAAATLREERGRALLVEAAAARQAAYRLEGEPREAGLLAAAGRFAVLADDPMMPSSIRAEGAFRAGEILRARKLSEQAGERFRQARDLGLAAPVDTAGAAGARIFGARAALELAHAQRRDADAEVALAAYGEVSLGFPRQARQVGQAAVWRVRLLMDMGRSDAAQAEGAVLSDLVALDPMEAIRAAEGIATELAEGGEMPRAEAVLGALEHHLGSRLVEPDGKLAVALSAVRVTVRSYGS